MTGMLQTLGVVLAIIAVGAVATWIWLQDVQQSSALADLKKRAGYRQR